MSTPESLYCRHLRINCAAGSALVRLMLQVQQLLILQHLETSFVFIYTYVPSVIDHVSMTHCALGMDTQFPHPQTHIVHLMCGPQHETRQRDASITQLSPNGHFTFLEEHSRSSSVYDEIVESYSEARRKSHQESFSSTVRNIASQPALRREEWSTGA
ncbi:hypothetical protein QBC45DRAFT_168493 [Copromyces sp. CBS 386.78]|nr:hypothetical protein QBC45DRAFT_168493 [Copromyces sp. CBS 386.78]